MPEYSIEETSRTFERVVTREKISQSLVTGKESLRKVIKEARERPISHQEIESIAKQLAEDEFLVAENINAFAKRIHQALKEEYPNEEISLVILGSGVHGGHKVRQLLGSSKDSDIDLGIIISSKHSSDNPEEMYEYSKEVSRFIRDWITENHGEGEPDHLCRFINPGGYNALEIVDQNDASKRLIEISSESYTSSLIRDTILLFYPSIPEETNIRNRDLIIQSLKKLYIENPGAWKNVVSRLTEEWSQHHEIKVKHLVGGMTDKYYENTKNVYDTNSYKIIQKARDQLFKIMQKPFENLLESSKQ